MRILFWSGTFWPHIGGVEVLAAKFLPAMRERGYEFVVIAPKLFADLPDEESYEGIPVHRFLFRSSLVDKSIDHVMDTRHRLLKLKRAFTPDIVHINAVGVDNFFHLTTASAHRAATLVTLHGKWSHQADITVGRTLKNADWVVGCSAAQENRRPVR